MEEAFQDDLMVEISSRPVSLNSIGMKKVAYYFPFRYRLGRVHGHTSQPQLAAEGRAQTPTRP